MHKIAVFIMVGIALASHTTGSMLLQCTEINVNNLLSCLFPAFRNGKGHNIPYHNSYSFGFTAGNNMASWQQKMLHALQEEDNFPDKR